MWSLPSPSYPTKRSPISIPVKKSMMNATQSLTLHQRLLSVEEHDRCRAANRKMTIRLTLCSRHKKPWSSESIQIKLAYYESWKIIPSLKICVSVKSSLLRKAAPPRRPVSRKPSTGRYMPNVTGVSRSTAAHRALRSEITIPGQSALVGRLSTGS